MADHDSNWVIVVWNNKRKLFPAASKLIDVGVPLAMARRYQIVRREMTAGLRRKVKQAVN